MALKPCKECKAAVSTSAKVCPYCGAKKPTESWKSFFWVLFGIFLISSIPKLCTSPKVEPKSYGIVDYFPDSSIASSSSTAISSSNSYSQAKKIFNNFDLCKAAISTEMGRPVKSIKVKKSSEDSPEISYVRADDGDNFYYNCKVENNRIIWRTYFNDSLQVGWGRWRNEEGDSVITYSIKDKTLTIFNSFGGITKEFQKKDF